MSSIGISRVEAIEILHKYIKNSNMRKHCIASEAVMRALAIHFGEDPDEWGIVGLLHDIDVELVNADLNVHGLEAEKILSEIGLRADLIEAIKLHNEKATGIKRFKRLHHALAAAETITGLIIATTLVYPDKKLASVKAKSITKRMKEKAFAASVSRENIKECEKIDIPVSDFARISLQAMQEISGQLGL